MVAKQLRAGASISLVPVMDAPKSDDAQQRLLPRFSIRALLAMLSLCAVAFLIVGTAYRGQYWAWGVTIGLFSLLITALVHAAVFGIAWLFAQMTSAQPRDHE